MDYLETVRMIAAEFTEDPSYVHIGSRVYLMEFAESMKKIAAKEDAVGLKNVWGSPSCLLDEHGNKDILKHIKYELLANSVNYCYWYAKHGVRFLGCSSGKMYELLTQSFEEQDIKEKTADYSSEHAMDNIVESFIEKLSRARFPMLEERVRHIQEVGRLHSWALEALVNNDPNVTANDCLDHLITRCPGYGKDLFLKRALLFLISMNRTCGLFEEEIHNISVPADYQVPKMLRWYKCIWYSKELEDMIRNGELIPEGSRMECEIRATTVRVCNILAKHTGWSPSEVDSFLWGRRKECNHPFHLTISTSY